MIKKHLLATAMGILGSTASACDVVPDGAALLLASDHVGTERDYNETNTGLFLMWDCGPVSSRVGTFNNSFEEQSWSVSFTSDYTTLSLGGFNAALTVGAALYPETGRTQFASIKDSDWLYLAGLEFTHDDLPFFIHLYPGDPGQDVGGYSHLVAWGLQVEF